MQYKIFNLPHNRKEDKLTKKPVLQIESDGKWSRVDLFGLDISSFVDSCEIKIKPGEVTLSLELSRLDRATNQGEC